MKRALMIEKGMAWGSLPNGVYAVSSNYDPVLVENADESCIAVALIADQHRYMVNKTEDKKYHTYGGYGKVSGTLMTNTCGGGSNVNYGTFGSTINLNWRTWTNPNTAMGDFTGKESAAFIKKITTNGGQTNPNGYRPMATYMNAFNNGTGNNTGLYDWFIPTMGEMGLLYVHRDQLNEALTKIGGMTFFFEKYWTATEYNENAAWFLSFPENNVYGGDNGKVTYGNRIRLIREI